MSSAKTFFLDLPKRDKEGIPYVSYSQINSFKDYRFDYIRRYFLNEKDPPNDYMIFGNKVGEALERNDFSKFDESERDTLSQVTRLDLFEREIRLVYGGFYVLGYVDTASEDLSHIIDFKTGGKGKHTKYKKANYTQLDIYAMAIKQETGRWPKRVGVEFIERSRDFKVVGNIKKIERPFNLSDYKNTYRDVWTTAHEISALWKKFKENGRKL
jgi:hypothetical protein